MVSAVDDQSQVFQRFMTNRNGLNEYVFWRQCHYLIIIFFAFLSIENNPDRLFRRSQNLKSHLTLSGILNIENKVLRSLFHNTDFTIRHEVLHKLLFFVRHEPCEVGLVLRIDTRHQFDIRPEAFTDCSDGQTVSCSSYSLIREITIPGAPEVTIAPGPLLLAWREVMAGHMQHTALRIVLITALEVILRIDSHV